MLTNDQIDDGPITSKLHKICCCTSCCCACNSIFRSCRKAVSGSKRRTRKGSYDLDMTYVAPRIIVHGFPATGLEHIYRNPRGEIKRFMDEFHHDHYKVYNFCCEYGRGYDPKVFHGRVERYPFKDHNIPPLETMVAFADSVKAWQDEDPANVVNIHCKAGKGRAGLMCCVALIRTGVAQSAVQALEIYDRERVTNNKGLTVTSQRKMVIFYEQLWRKHWDVSSDIGAISVVKGKYELPIQPAFHLYGVEVLNLPLDLADSLRVKVSNVTNFGRQQLYDSKVMKSNSVSIQCDCILEKNFCIAIQFKKGIFGSFIKLMELLHNTYFMESGATFIDFGLGQLDTKKKIKEKLFTNIMLRLKFVKDESNMAIVDTENIVEVELGNPISSSSSTVKEYTLVPNNEKENQLEVNL